MIRILFFYLLFCCSSSLFAQDSLRYLSEQQVMDMVRAYHPVSRQAAIVTAKADADITIARGEFDPVFFQEQAQKTFDGTRYYSYSRPQVTIPTWLGVDIVGGLEYLSGDRTDPEDTKGRTSFAGISVPLAKNLLMDKRRAALKTAKIFQQSSRAEQRRMLNDLLLQAAKAYWYWVKHYQLYRLADDAVKVNEQRLQLVRTAFRLGERPAIDTTETQSQLLSFSVLRENARLEWQNAALELAVFLWSPEGAPLRLPPQTVPADENNLLSGVREPLPALDSMLAIAQKNHPELLLYEYKLGSLAVERKLKFQQLLPAVNFRYNQLSKSYNIFQSKGPLFENNYRFGFYISMPLRLSEGRGEYRKAKLKIQETQLGLNLKQVELEQKIRSGYNELVALKNQVQLQERAHQAYLALQRGEETRFTGGESSLFLVNARENKTLEALQKLQELRVKFRLAGWYLRWTAGDLAN